MKSKLWRSFDFILAEETPEEFRRWQKNLRFFTLAVGKIQPVGC
jgi:hypothetical protein